MRALALLVFVVTTSLGSNAFACRIPWSASRTIPRVAESAENVVIGRVLRLDTGEGGQTEIQPLAVLRGSAPALIVIPASDERVCSPSTNDWLSRTEVGMTVVLLTGEQDWLYAIGPLDSDLGRMMLGEPVSGPVF